MKFMKGPWKVVNMPESDFIDIQSDDWYDVCRITKADYTGEIDANARLIAQAPAMAELLRRLVDVDENPDELADEAKKILAEIEKETK